MDVVQPVIHRIRPQFRGLYCQLLFLSRNVFKGILTVVTSTARLKYNIEVRRLLFRDITQNVIFDVVIQTHESIQARAINLKNYAKLSNELECF